MYLWEDKYITMTRGDTLAFGLEFEGLDQDLETAFFSCRKNHTDDLAFQKSLGNGIYKVADGQYGVRVAPSDTKYLNPGKYYYDLQIGVNGDVFTILKGILELECDVTM